MQNWIMGISGYFVIWWIALFVVLPFGVNRDDNPTVGHDIGAPKDAKIKQKFIATSILSLFIWILIYAFIHYGILNYWVEHFGLGF